MPDFTPSFDPTIMHPRLAAYRQLIGNINRGQTAASGSIWLDFLNRLPVTLGESSADRVVRYSVSDRVYQVICHGVDGIADLIKRRADSAYDQEKKSALLPDPSRQVVLWPKRYCPRTIPEDSPLRGIVAMGLLESSDLDAGILESWLSRPAGGMTLFELVRTLISDSMLYAREQPAFSGVALMVHFALLNTLLQAKERIKKVKVKNMKYARLERAVGMALHACFSRATREALAAEDSFGPINTEHSDKVVVLSSLGPLAFFSIQKTELTADINPYRLSDQVEQRLSAAYRSALERGND
ncbi:MAG: hypothetical protein JRJ87_19785, partial [Deltaproteobacteria bacterium]|nr:hypothetical protein [Deltaproteobacteria bacterium]